MTADLREPKVYVGKTVVPVERQHARELNLQLERLCGSCGHVDGVHDVDMLAPGAQLVRSLEGESAACRWPKCRCREWVPREGVTPPDWGRVLVREVWVEAPVGADWIAAYRLTPQNGMPVIAELRVFPAEVSHSTPGRWSGEWLGVHAHVPAGGLTARQVKRVRTAIHVRRMGDLLHQWRKKMVTVSDVKFGSIWGDEPSTASPRAAWKRSSAAERVGNHQGRPGRKRRPPEYYLDVAVAYARAVEAGSRHPIADVARALGRPLPWVRDMVHRARALGLLTRTSRGRLGGVLTKEARGLLRLGRRREKIGDAQRAGRSRPRTRRRSRS